MNWICCIVSYLCVYNTATTEQQKIKENYRFRFRSNINAPLVRELNYFVEVLWRKLLVEEVYVFCNLWNALDNFFLQNFIRKFNAFNFVHSPRS